MNNKNEINIIHVYFDNTFNFQNLKRKLFRLCSSLYYFIDKSQK